MRKLALAVAALLFATTGSARLIQVPSYQELTDKSDLVVIAAPISTRDTSERVDRPGTTMATPDKRAVGFPVVGVETRFRASAVLKGNRTLREFVLHHYREAIAQPTINAPALAAFDPAKKTSLLLFVVREADGRYAPTAGQTDPGYLSIHPLGSYVK